MSFPGTGQVSTSGLTSQTGHSKDQITQSQVWVCSSSGRPYPWEHLSPGTLLSALLPKFPVGQMLGMNEWGTALLGLCLLLPSFKTRLQAKFFGAPIHLSLAKPYSSSLCFLYETQLRPARSFRQKALYLTKKWGGG